MVYLLNLIWGTTILSVYDKKYWKSSPLVSLFLFLPFIIIWVFVIGGQYDVGTDYQRYLDRFNGVSDAGLYDRKGELLFYYIIIISRFFGITGQGIFFVLAIISALLYWCISRKLAENQSALFFFLFITVSTLFHNQMNGIRQCTAVYFITLALIFLFEKKNVYFFILVIVATGIHFSSILILPFYFIRNKTINSVFIAKSLIIIATIISFISLDSFIRGIIEGLPFYSHYADSEYLRPVPVINKLTKLTLLPFYYFSTILLKNNFLSNTEMRFYQLGFFCYLLRTLSLVSTVSNRAGIFFLILSTLPLFYYLVYMKTKNYKLFILFSCYILSFYLIKILLMPSSEYLYSSIYEFFF